MSLETAELSIALEELESWRRRIRVTVPAGAVRDERERAIRALGSRLKLKGFRKGRVPSGVIEKRFGPSVERDVLDRVIGAAYKEAIQRESLHPISEGEVETIDYEPGTDLSFTISFDIQPEIPVERLGGFAVERPRIEVEDDQVDRVIQRIRQQHGTWVPREDGAATREDLVKVTIVELDPDSGEPASEEPREYEFVLGQGDAIPDVEAAIQTLEVGQEGEFDVTFPDDFPQESRRGDRERLRVRLDGRKVLELPEVDDAFAAQVGPFETADELLARVREDLQREAQDQAEGAVRGRLLDLLVEANAFEVPGSMVDRYLDSLLGDVEEADQERVAQARQSLRAEAERAVKRLLLIERVAATQDLEATEADLDERIEEIAGKSGTSPAEVYGRLQKSGRLEALEREITERKVFDFLKSRSEITEAV